MTKRNRSVNWDEEEKQLFCSVLKDFAKIIEDKTLTTTTNKLKAKAWEEVHRNFNILNSRKRDLNQLKIQWKGMKMSVRKQYGKYKRESIKTGREESPTTPDDAIIEIKDLLNPAEILLDHNTHDFDGIKRECELRKSNMKNCVPKCQKDNEDYITVIDQHSKELKEKEHTKRLAMADEKHALEIAILKENLKTAQLERQIAEKKLEKLM